MAAASSKSSGSSPASASTSSRVSPSRGAPPIKVTAESLAAAGGSSPVLNRRERRAAAREQGLLVQKVIRGGVIVLDTGTAPPPPVIGEVAMAIPAPLAGRSSRSTVDLKEMLLAPKDWPSRHEKKIVAAGSSGAAPAAEAASVKTPRKKGKKEAEAAEAERDADAASTETDAPQTPAHNTPRASGVKRKAPPALARIDESAAADAMEDVAAPAASPRNAASGAGSRAASPRTPSSHTRSSTPRAAAAAGGGAARQRRAALFPASEDEADEADADNDAVSGRASDASGREGVVRLMAKLKHPPRGTAAKKDDAEDAASVDSHESDAPRPSKKQRARSPSSSASSPAPAGSAAAASAKKVFPFGNYDRYYGYRSGAAGGGSSVWSDARVSLFRSEWFSGKRVLDLGCNSGLVTVLVASLFAPLRIVGVDLDATLVRKAQDTVQQRVAWIKAHPHPQSQPQPQPQSPPSASGQLMRPRPMAGSRPLVPLSSIGALPPPASGSFPTGSSSGSGSAQLTGKPAAFPHNISFVTANLLSYLGQPAAGAAGSGSPVSGSGSSGVESGSVDCVLLLSVTKWLHFHHGDSGLRQCFALVDRALSPGGLCVLEPQPFASYKKKASLSPEIRQRVAQIQLRPEQFPAYLQQTHGWRLKHAFTTQPQPQQTQGGAQTQGTDAQQEDGGAAAGAGTPPVGGFHARPLYVFQKPL